MENGDNRLPPTMKNIILACLRLSKDPMISYCLRACLPAIKQSMRMGRYGRGNNLVVETGLTRELAMMYGKHSCIRALDSKGPDRYHIAVDINATSRYMDSGWDREMFKFNVRVSYPGNPSIGKPDFSWTKLKKYLFPLRIERHVFDYGLTDQSKQRYKEVKQYLLNHGLIPYQEREYGLYRDDRIYLVLARATDDEAPVNILDWHKDHIIQSSF